MSSTLTHKLLSLVSEVFSPFVLAGLLITLIAVVTDNAWFLPVLICLTFIVGIPQVLSIYMHRANLTTDRFIQVRKQRTPFFIGSLISMLVGVVVLNLVGTSHDVVIALNLAVLSLIAVIGINLKIKISLHAFVAALFAIVAPVYLGASVFSVVLGGVIWTLTVWSRYYLKRHSGFELILGTIGGVIVAGLHLWLR